MEKLMRMEKNMRDHIEDYALAEETLQVCSDVFPFTHTIQLDVE
jgi:hypothetical protein